MKIKRVPRMDLVGKRFGRLVVIDVADVDLPKRLAWNVVCDCGNKRVVNGRDLITRNTSSCGCLRVDTSRASMTTHGAASLRPYTAEYRAWMAMKTRCLNRNTKAFKDYGGRGITICPRWLDSFENFLADMGKRPDGLSLDRMNNDGNYEPGNCRWATRREQRLNCRPKALKGRE
jgi:hypothetical protein